MRRTITILGAAAVLTTACARQQKPAAAVKQPVPVRAAVVEMASSATEMRYSGVIAADTQVDLAFRISGYVEQIGRTAGREFSEGDFVPAGTVLARLRPVEYQQRAAYAKAVTADAEAVLGAQRAQLSEAETAHAQAARDFDRAARLFAEKAMTRADYEAVESRRSQAAARRDSALAQIAAQQARIAGAGAQHGEASVTLQDTALAAPFPGVIVAKRVARGSFVSPGAPAFVLADVRIVKVTFGVPDLALSGFRLGDSLTVAAEAVSGREFTGRVSMISPAADPSSRVFPVEVSIDNGGNALKAGMVATVVVTAREASQAPAIPLAAVVRARSADAGFAVYTIDNRDGVERVHLQPVTLGAIRGNSVLIASGLGPGQRIVATGGLQLADGEAVKQVP